MRLSEPFDKPMKTAPTKHQRRVMVTRTTMEPSSTSTGTQLRATSSSEAWEDARSLARQVPRPHPEEPLLYLMPSDLYPTYRPLPVLAQSVVVFLSMWASAVSTWQRLTFLQPLAILRGWRSAPSFSECIAFAAKTILFTLLAQLSLQEVFCPPSRISMQDLCRKYYLPSAISKYESLQVPNSKGLPASIGVHYLKCSKEDVKKPSLLDAVYVHHGFGASSLSWLPALPSLVDRLGARVGLGHDMVGFGFTDRQRQLDWYTTDASARISQAVFMKETADELGGKPPNSVVVMGHSLGCIGALKMALQLPLDTTKLIVLCAPALGLSSKFKDESSSSEGEQADSSGWVRSLRFAASSFLRKAIAFPLGGYVLRRVVGLKNSWKLGLKTTAWGNPERLRDSDVLRYQWPSIGKGWERGLLQFATAQKSFDDRSLFRQVLDLPNTTVAIILGSKDKVIPVQTTQEFLSDFKEYNLNVVQLEGLGHNAFEEDVETFMSVIEKIVNKET